MACARLRCSVSCVGPCWVSEDEIKVKNVSMIELSLGGAVRKLSDEAVRAFVLWWQLVPGAVGGIGPWSPLAWRRMEVALNASCMRLLILRDLREHEVASHCGLLRRRT